MDAPAHQIPLPDALSVSEGSGCDAVLRGVGGQNLIMGQVTGKRLCGGLRFGGKLDPPPSCQIPLKEGHILQIDRPVAVGIRIAGIRDHIPRRQLPPQQGYTISRSMYS